VSRRALTSILSLVILLWSGCGPVSPRISAETSTTLPAATPLASTETVTARPAPASQPEQVEIIAAWDFTAQQKAQGWQPSNDLAHFTFDAAGLVTRSTGGDPYMNGPSIQLDPVAAPHFEISMRSSRGNDAQLFWDVNGQGFNETASLHFTVKPDGEWHTYRLDMKGHPAWKGTITRLRLDPSNQSGAELGIAWIHAIGPLPVNLQAGAFGPDSAIQAAGQPFTLNAILSNTGDLDAPQFSLRLDLPAGLQLAGSEDEQVLPFLEAGSQSTTQWQISGAAGVYPVGLVSGSQRLKTTTIIVEDRAAGDLLEVQNNAVRLSFVRQAFGYGIATLERKTSIATQPAGRMRSLGQVIYRDAAGNEHTALLYAPTGALQNGVLTFEATHTTPDGAVLTETVAIQPEKDMPWFRLDYQLKTSQPVDLLSWSGPEFLAGEGSSGAQLDSGLFPGLEFLSAGEQSSGKDFVAPPINLRYVPNPNKITLPFMSVTAQNGASGLMWDPLQTWDGTHDRPAALYAAPNTWENQSNHLMRLFVPGMTAGLEENHDRLSTPFAFRPGQPLKLSAALFAAQAVDSLSALETYLDYSQIDETLKQAQAVQWPRTLEDETRLCLLNYTDKTWDASKNGWHYVLSDPWGPGSNPAVSLHLWIATLTGKPDDTTKALRRMVTSSLDSPVAGGQPNPWYYQPALLLQLPGTLGDLRNQVNEVVSIAAQQRDDGSWGYQPDSSSTQNFGRAGDTSNGYTATMAYRVLYFARLSGDTRLESAGRKALNYLAAQSLRPEGAQTWELSLHVPDLLASAWVMQSFIEGYRLTGELRYLALADQWALSGLPFIYTWNPPDRPIMRYTTIPVFGASNYTSPWFGRPVMWNGLDYAIGLQNLAAEETRANMTSRLDWKRLAEGITSAAAQMQPEDGPYAGMYPDAWDATTGEEAYTWWLSPTYLMQNLLLLQGNPASQVSTRILILDSAQMHINAPAEILSAGSSPGHLSLRLRYVAGESADIWLTALANPPTKITVNGATALQTTWTYEDNMLLLSVPFNAAETAVELEF
jgi:hypothetical protein